MTVVTALERSPFDNLEKRLNLRYVCAVLPIALDWVSTRKASVNLWRLSLEEMLQLRIGSKSYLFRIKVSHLHLNTPSPHSPYKTMTSVLIILEHSCSRLFFLSISYLCPSPFQSLLTNRHPQPVIGVLDPPVKNSKRRVFVVPVKFIHTDSYNLNQIFFSLSIPHRSKEEPKEKSFLVLRDKMADTTSWRLHNGTMVTNAGYGTSSTLLNKAIAIA